MAKALYSGGRIRSHGLRLIVFAMRKVTKSRRTLQVHSRLVISKYVGGGGRMDRMGKLAVGIVEFSEAKKLRRPKAMKMYKSLVM